MQRLKWRPSELKAYQTQNLRRIITNAYENVPFYHRTFKAAHITPSDIKTIEDLNRLPIVTKSDLKIVSTNDLISRKVRLENLLKVTTGGSTGNPFSFYLDAREDAWRKAISYRAKLACGQRLSDRWATISSESTGNSCVLQRLLGLGVRSIIPITLDRCTRLRVVRELNPEVLDGFPSALFLLAKDYEKSGGSSIAPRLVFGSGELVDKHTIHYIENTFHTKYHDQLGCTEVNRSAWQCPLQEGYHMDVDSVITQFVDRDGCEVSSTEEGEIVYTSLFNTNFPIIRYNIKDVGVPSNERCSCGITLPLLKMIKGRSNFFLIFPDHQVVSPFNFIETLGAYKLEHEIEEYVVVQQKPDFIRIFIKKTSAYIDEDKIRKVLATNLSRGYSMSNIFFEFEFVDSIPRNSRGKLNVIHSYLPEALFYNEC
jgi:phenylacetate-CoA ligase